MNAAEIEELLTKLVQIPAPTGREQKRAEYITDWLKELGYHPFTDAAGNVIVEMKVQEGGFVFFNGGCPRHLAVTLDDALKAKELHPHAELLVHPECRPDVVAEADYVGSTTGIMADRKSVV